SRSNQPRVTEKFQSLFTDTTSTKGSYCSMQITGTSYVSGCTGNQAIYYTAIQVNRSYVLIKKAAINSGFFII
ncbi:hypothetical protein AB6D11_24225, partial [Vibrio splendidus]